MRNKQKLRRMMHTLMIALETIKVVDLHRQVGPIAAMPATLASYHRIRSIPWWVMRADKPEVDERRARRWKRSQYKRRGNTVTISVNGSTVSREQVKTMIEEINRATQVP